MNELFKAMSRAQAQMKGAVKDATNPHFRSRYADLESVIEAIRKPFADNGLCFFQRVADGMLVTTIAHESGESFESAVPLIITKQDCQGLGSSLTYSRRYGIAAAAGISQTDDDGNAACEPPSKPPPPAYKASQPTPKREKTSPDDPVEQYRHTKHRDLCVIEAGKLGISSNALLLHKEKLVPFLESNASTEDLPRWLEAFFKKEEAAK
jgi:hypothetical protein